MWRIHFEPKIGKFVIQVLRYGMFWVSVRGGEEVLSFVTHDDALSHVVHIGLDRLYRDRSANTQPTFMSTLSHG